MCICACTCCVLKFVAKQQLANELSPAKIISKGTSACNSHGYFNTERAYEPRRQLCLFQIEETEQSKVAVPNTFAIYGGSRCILVAAR